MSSQSDAAVSRPYQVTVNYDLPLEAAIEAGAYDSMADEYEGQVWSDWKSPDRSPLAPRSGTSEKELLLFHVEAYFGEGPYPETEEILTALADESLIAETVYELLALGHAHPDIQRQFPVYELGSVWVRQSSDARFVSGLVADQRLRRLGLSSYLIQWPPQLRMLVSRA